MIDRKTDEFQSLIALFDQKASTILMTAGIMLPLTLGFFQGPQNGWALAFQLIAIAGLTGCVLAAGLSLWPRWSPASSGASFVSVARLQNVECVSDFMATASTAENNEHAVQLYDLAKILYHKAILLRISIGLLLLAVLALAANVMV